MTRIHPNMLKDWHTDYYEKSTILDEKTNGLAHEWQNISVKLVIK